MNANGNGEFGLDVIASMDYSGDRTGNDLSFFNDLIRSIVAEGRDAPDAANASDVAETSAASSCTASTPARRKATGCCSAIIGRK